MEKAEPTSGREPQPSRHAHAPIPIAFCITELDPGGAERALAELVTRLEQSEWSPHVYCLAPRGVMADVFERAGVPVTCLEANRFRQMPLTVWRLARLLRRQRPAILQTFLFHANFIGRLAARLAGVPHVVSGIRVAERGTRWHLPLDRWTNRLVDLNICVSRGVAEFMHHEAGLKPAKLVVIPNGVDAERFANASPADLSQFGIPSGSRTVVTVGRLHPQKGLHDLLDALRGLFRHFSDLHLLLVGAGPQEAELRSRVRDENLTDRVHFAGWQPDVAPILRACQVLVLASRWEGMPNVILEAMAAGLPVVATEVEGVSELIVNGSTGLIVPPANSAALRDAIERLLSEADLAKQIAVNSQAIAMKRFTWQATVAEYIRIYRELLA